VARGAGNTLKKTGGAKPEAGSLLQKPTYEANNAGIKMGYERAGQKR